MSDEVKLMQRFYELKTFLLKQNYPEKKLVDHGIKKALETDREELRKKVPAKNVHILPYICYNIKPKKH